MKTYKHIILIISITIVVPSISFAQREVKKLSITTSIQQLEGGQDRSVLQDLMLELDRKQIKKVERIYIKLLKTENRERVLVKAIDKEVLKGVQKDEKVKRVSIDKDKVKINLGSFEHGEYYLYVRIKDENRQMYLDRKIITL